MEVGCDFETEFQQEVFSFDQIKLVFFKVSTVPFRENILLLHV